MMNRRLIVWATSLCLMVSVSGIRAGEKLSLKAITSGEFRSEVMQAVRPLADGETYGQMSADGKRSGWQSCLMSPRPVVPNWIRSMIIS